MTRNFFVSSLGFAAATLVACTDGHGLETVDGASDLVAPNDATEVDAVDGDITVMDTAAERAVNAGQAATLAYIRLDRYASLLAETGLAGIDLLLTDLANLLRAHFAGSAQLARFGDDVFSALLISQSAEQSQHSLQELLKKV